MRLKTHKLLGFCGMLFQFTLTKFSKIGLFSCLQKDDHVTNYCKRPISLIFFRRIKRKWRQARWKSKRSTCEGGIVKSTRACWIWDDYSQLIFNAHSWNYKGALASTTTTAAKPLVRSRLPALVLSLSRLFQFAENGKCRRISLELILEDRTQV